MTKKLNPAEKARRAEVRRLRRELGKPETPEQRSWWNTAGPDELPPWRGSIAELNDRLHDLLTPEERNAPPKKTYVRWNPI